MSGIGYLAPSQPNTVSTIVLGRRFFQNADKSLPLRGLSALLLLEIALLLLVVAPSQTHTMPSLLNVRFEKTNTLTLIK